MDNWSSKTESTRVLVRVKSSGDRVTRRDPDKTPELSKLRNTIRARLVPSFAKEGWLRHKEKRPRSLVSADGVVVSSHRLSNPIGVISGSLKQLPRPLLKGCFAAFSLGRVHPFFAKKTSEVEFQHRSSRFFHSFDQECGQWRPVFEQRFRVNLILIRLSIFPTPK